jgi:AraC-like DNA-binding protein
VSRKRSSTPAMNSLGGTEEPFPPRDGLSGASARRSNGFDPGGGEVAKPPGTAPVVFSTDAISARERFDYWRATFASVHDVEIESERRVAFSARGSHWLLGSILFGVYKTPARRVVRTAKRCAQDDLDHWVLRVPTAGRIMCQSNSGASVVEPGELIFSTYGRPYEEKQVAGEWIAVMFPRDVLPRLRGGPPPGSVLKNIPAQILADFLRLLPRRLIEAEEEDVISIAEATRAMIAACIRPAEISLEDEELVVRERVNQVILKHIGSARLDPERLCGLSGLSRAKLYRLFEHRGGVARHLQRIRLGLVRSDLTDPFLASVPIAKVAATRGLYNLASFNRAFRREFGCTPGEMRTASLVGAPLPLAPARRNGDASPRFRDLLA